MLLDGWRRTGERTHQVIARWPRGDSLYTGPDGRPDPMLYIEAVRQCLPLLSHAAFAVPLEHHLVWESFRCALGPDAPEPGRRLDEAIIDVHCDEVRARGTRVTALTLSFTMRQDTAILATAHTRFTVQTPPVYRRLRGERLGTSSASLPRSPLPEPLNARSVGRLAESDVLLAASARPYAWRLRADMRHPVFFDHPVDHIPGALLLGAAPNRKQVEVAFLQPRHGAEPACSATVTRVRPTRPRPAACGRAAPGRGRWRSRSRCR